MISSGGAGFQSEQKGAGSLHSGPATLVAVGTACLMAGVGDGRILSRVRPSCLPHAQQLTQCILALIHWSAGGSLQFRSSTASAAKVCRILRNRILPSTLGGQPRAMAIVVLCFQSC